MVMVMVMVIQATELLDGARWCCHRVSPWYFTAVLYLKCVGVLLSLTWLPVNLCLISGRDFSGQKVTTHDGVFCS